MLTVTEGAVVTHDGSMWEIADVHIIDDDREYSGVHEVLWGDGDQDRLLYVVRLKVICSTCSV